METPLVVKIAEAVADARGKSVDSLDPLGSYFDPEALEFFIRSTTISTEVVLELDGCTTRIDADGTVTVIQDGTPEDQ